MNAIMVDNAVRNQLNELGQRVLDGGKLSREEALWILNLQATEDLFELFGWANRIRQAFKGNRIQLCSIVNAKAGACPEDCKFCAQSAFSQTDAPRSGFIDPEAVKTAAEEAHRNGVNALGLVAAWKGLKEGPMLDEVCARLRELAALGTVRTDGSFGIIKSQRVADRLRESGLVCYNHNLESSTRFYPTVCTTHSWQDRVDTLTFLKRAGIRICSGGIIGMGETREDRCDLALALREAGSDMVPINILNPIPGTPFEKVPPTPPLESLKTVACFRFLMPTAEIGLAGGRVGNLRDVQSLIFMAGASALMVGNYLTTVNQPVEKDLQMLRDLGLEAGTARAK